MLDALGRGISRHPWVFVAGWAALVTVAFAVAFGGVLGQGLFDRLTAGTITLPGEAQDGVNLIAATARSGPSELLVLDGVAPLRNGPLSLRAGDPTVRRAVNAAHGDLVKLPHVQSVFDPWNGKDTLNPTSPAFIADDGRALLMVVTLDPGLPVAKDKHDPAAGTQEYVLGQARDRLERVPARVSGSRALVGGLNDITTEVTDQVEHDLRTGEGVALPLSLLIMVVVFGGFLAAGLPIVGAVASIGGAMATLFGFSYLIQLDASTVNVVTVLGLGLCIDYGLLLVSRYREEMLRLPGDPALPPTRRQRELALCRTMTSAGRTVTFSGVTVAVALTGLMCFQASFLRAIGLAGICIVVVAMLVALTLVPALLALVRVRMIRPGLVHRLPLLGRVARALGDEPPDDGFFARLARTVQRFPLIVVLIVLSALFVMSLPLLRMQLVASGPALLPVSNPQREVFDDLAGRFPLAAPPTVQVVTRRHLRAGDAYLRQLKRVAAVTSVADPVRQGSARTGRVWVVDVRVAGSDSSPVALQAVRDIRALSPPFRVDVTGNAALLVDYDQDLRGRTPLAVGIVVLATFVLLFLMTGSVLVPVKALLMNVVSLGACLGVIVWIFQDGNLEGLLGFSSSGGIETFIPPLTLAFGFGLAMDYEVFLISRIADFRRQGHPNDEAVVMGLQRSGRIITSAAVIVVVVFLGFVSGQLLIIKETGAALAVAVAIDASLVRMLLVPATMTLLGEWNWWAPGFLRRFHDRYGISE